MLLLVDTDRDLVGLVKQDIRRHQDRVIEQADVDVVRMLCRFILKLGHTAHLAEHRVAVEHPCQLCVRRDMALDEQDRFLGVNAAGDILRKKLERIAPQARRVLPDRDRVHVNDAVNAIVFVLKGAKVLDRTEVVAQRQMAGHQRKLFACWGLSSIMTSFAVNLRIWQYFRYHIIKCAQMQANISRNSCLACVRVQFREGCCRF